LKKHIEYNKGALKHLSRLFLSGVVQCSWTEYKNASHYDQLSLSLVAEERLRCKSKMAGAKIR
jgi:hypothetical protein